MLRVLAVDLGATSGRVAEVDLDATPPAVEMIHRYPHRAVDGRWDWDRLVAETQRGLRPGIERGPVASIGIDTWGVDYGLLDGRGHLLSAPYSYRHPRTANWRTVASRIGEDHLYTTTGIQLMGLNTIFQLAAHDREELGAARRLLMLPELLVHELTGVATGERTSAGTTALVELATGDWSGELLDAIGVDPTIMPAIAPAATPVGTWQGVPVHLVGGHDTASAIAALPGPPAADAAFVSAGTWFLAGAERDAADVSPFAREANFSNEPGVFGGVRFLKNVAGLWLLDRCRAEWGEAPLEEAAQLPAGGPTVDPNDDRFVDPSSMEAEIRNAAGLADGAGRGAVVRCILDSLAAAVAQVVAELRDPSEVIVVGGGARNRLLVSLLAEACDLPVRTGSPEATALGNALVQGIALGRYASLAEARIAIGTSG